MIPRALLEYRKGKRVTLKSLAYVSWRLREHEERNSD